jgi:hypothetical protein
MGAIVALDGVGDCCVGPIAPAQITGKRRLVA